MKSAKLGLTFLCIALAAMVGASTAAAEFGIKVFKTTYQDPFGAPGEELLQAGAHADVVTKLDFDDGKDAEGRTIVDGQPRDIEVDLPAGFYGNPAAVETCTMEQIVKLDGVCKPAAQVGVLRYEAFTATFLEFPVYNLKSPDEQTAVLGVVALSIPAKIVISARTDGDFGLTANLKNLNQGLSLLQNELTLWGVPADPVHDGKRFGNGGIFDTGHPAGVPPVPFLSLPARCEPMATTVHVDSWQNPGPRDADGVAIHNDPRWRSATRTTPPLTGCDKLDFSPTLSARPTTDAADSPSGLESTLTIPQNTEDPKGLSSAMLRRAEVELPEGLVINPAAANGLDACSPAEIGLTTAVGAGDPHFNRTPAACPDGSKIGSVEVNTPVFEDPLKGDVYVMEPHQNPYGDLLGLYLAIEGKGLVIKQAGKVTADPKTGRLSASFAENPQLTFEELKLDLNGGAYGILRTPSACGSYVTTSTLTPWSAPETPTVTDKDTYAISRAPAGGSCAATEAARPAAPGFEAGSLSTIAGKYSPFVFKLSRNDGTRQLSGIDAVLPPGLLAKLAGTAYCPEASLAAAAAKDGKAEQAAPSCPATSRVGQVTVGSGAGPKPFYAPGTAYLAGPYKGAPLSLAVVVPAVAGPFDLGTVVVRNALFVDPTTARVHAVSDPFPTILEGIPLDVRSVDLRLDKPEFTKNPTSCNPFEITGLAASPSGAGAPLSSPFQVGECGRLAFKPKLAISLKGKTKRTGNPALTAVLKAPAGQANIKKTTVILPQTMFIDNAHINNPCTRVQFDAKQCPKGSILGKARAFSPLLDQPLEGPVYFRSNGGDRELPDLVADLGGQIHVTLVGFIDSLPVKGTESSRIRTRFVNVPDAPVSKFVLRMAGGKRGLIENSVNLCSAPQVATLQMEAHNAKTRSSSLPVGVKCGKGKKKRG